MQKGIYQHYKKKTQYHVFDIALHTETNEKLVLYKALQEHKDLTDEYGTRPVFARPYSMFFEDVEYEGKTVPRFKFISTE